MATLYATGRLGIRFGLLPWDKRELLEALLDCTRGHVALVERERSAASGVQGVEAVLERFRRHCRAHAALFVDLRRGGVPDTSRHDHDACPGYINDHKRHGLEHLFSEAKFEAIAGGPQEAAALKRHLAERKQIAVERGGDGSPRYSVKRVIGRGGERAKNRPQVVAVRAAAFA